MHFLWTLSVEKPGSAFEDFADDGEEFESLGPKVAASVSAIAVGEFSQNLGHAIEKLAQTGDMITGRQSLWLMYREFDLEEEGGHVYDMSDIMILRCESDAKLSSFYHNWVNTILCLTEPIPDKSLEFLLYAQLKNSTITEGRYWAVRSV